MKKILLGSVLLLLVVMLWPCNVMAVTLGKVKGKVVDVITGKPVLGAKITAILSGGPSDILEKQKYNKIVVETDRKGEFQFTGLSTNYVLYIHKEGYLSGGQEKFDMYDCNIPVDTTKLLGEIKSYPMPKRFKIRDGVVFDEEMGIGWQSRINSLPKTETIQRAEILIRATIKEHNDKNILGFNNWRLPKKEELISMCRLFVAYDHRKWFTPPYNSGPNAYFQNTSFYKMIGFEVQGNPYQIVCSAEDGKIIIIHFFAGKFGQPDINIGDHIGRVISAGLWLVRDKNP